MTHARVALLRSNAGRMLLPILAGAVLSGCLPSSCRETESRALYPADSLSRQIASDVTPDTLELTSRFTGTEDGALEYVRSVVFSEDGVLYAADAARGIVVALDADGRHLRTIASDLFSYPYAVSAYSDSAVVFSPGRHRIQAVRGDDVRDISSTPADIPLRGLLQYVHPLHDTLYVKLLGEEFEGFVAPIVEGAASERRVALPGPTWRRAGFLRSWGDTLLSLNGYRPVVDLVLPGGRLDSMRLLGFDSPMLSRLRLFELGQIDAPPLLSASAAAYGNRLFVLNMRPGWLRIDVYDRSGRLESVLTEPHPGFNRDYYPTDIAVRQLPESEAIQIAVAVLRPEARIDLYRWIDGG